MRNLHPTQASHPSWHILIKAGVQVLGRQQMEEKLNQTIYILEARQMYLSPHQIISQKLRFFTVL